MCAWMKHLVNQAVVAVTLGVLVCALAAPGEAAELAGELVTASGPVEVRPLGEGVWRAATLRAVLHPGDMVRTGPGGSAEVALVQGVFRMDENTVIILPPPRAVPAAAGEPTAIRLLLYRGRALFQILKERLEGSFDVITPSVIVGVKGTTFGLEQGATAGVVAFEGSVQVVPAGRPEAPPVTVGAGQFTQLVQGQLTPPQAHRPGAPGALWGGAPTGTENAPLSAPPSAPRPAPMGAGVTPGGAAGLAAPALAQIGGAPPVAAPALFGMGPPRLASVGGPLGSTGDFGKNLTSHTSGQNRGGGGRNHGKGKKMGCVKSNGKKAGC